MGLSFQKQKITSAIFFEIYHNLSPGDLIVLRSELALARIDIISL